jgi:hypothetical protein
LCYTHLLYFLIKFSGQWSSPTRTLGNRWISESWNQRREFQDGG